MKDEHVSLLKTQWQLAQMDDDDENVFATSTIDRYAARLLCKAVQLLKLFSLIVNMSRGNLLCDCLGTAIHNCSSSGSLFFATLRQNN